MNNLINADVLKKMQELEDKVKKDQLELKSYREIQVKSWTSGLSDADKLTKIQELKQELTTLELQEKQAVSEFKQKIADIKTSKKTLAETLELVGYIHKNGLTKSTTDPYRFNDPDKTCTIKRDDFGDYTFNYESIDWQKELKNSLMLKGLTYSQVNNIAYKCALALKSHLTSDIKA